MRDLNPLEKLGLELAAALWLRCRPAEGRLLAAFLLATGDQVLPFDVLDARIMGRGRAWADLRLHEAASEQGRNRLRVILHRLRVALPDLGHPDVIETIKGEGYRMVSAARPGILEQIEATA